MEQKSRRCEQIYILKEQQDIYFIKEDLLEVYTLLRAAKIPHQQQQTKKREEFRMLCNDANTKLYTVHYSRPKRIGNGPGAKSHFTWAKFTQFKLNAVCLLILNLIFFFWVVLLFCIIKYRWLFVKIQCELTSLCVSQVGHR